LVHRDVRRRIAIAAGASMQAREKREKPESGSAMRDEIPPLAD
jgi:hypothetical protein